MSIAPPSDIVLDVAQAADPLTRQAATLKLARAAAGGTSFDAALDARSTTAPAASGPAGTAGGARFLPSTAAGLAHLPHDSKQVTTDRKFEAMVLQNFIENIMPKDSELFGDKASADMCRTLMAEQISNQLARSGKLGIAKSIARFQDAKHDAEAAAPLPLTLAGAPRA